MSVVPAAPEPGLACVVLAHTAPDQVRRLVTALDPFPVFLHCDVRTPREAFRRMTEDLPARVTVMPRRRTGWGGWEMVAAELDGYRAALETTASHVAVLTGTDYPLMSSRAITEYLATVPGRSVTASQPLPLPQWGHGGGFWRLRFRFRAWRQHMLVLPVPRRVPRGVVIAGGSQLKLLAREDVAAVIRTVDARPDLVRFWRSTWIPDETFVYSVLHTPEFAPHFLERRVMGSAWYIKWDGAPRKSPPWLTSADLPELARHRDGAVPTIFARKFSSAADPLVLDEVERLARDRP
ncbi:Core-2/I-Branching enzyme [Geodermatophilus amargosae]|uniref:Peptide O-xylosyltransferase n=1 Tax=Geodermatophilus amargosae TaxID=1296565 RepID=A0A1I6X7F2_9ACTN|nr:beta-1,6-N-acetylglucosaminyltransferase [Geodermatophilus amargosae]SFT34189.1 Core-2/I-Branching enzyme [Geodermatophilus amargosae]